MGFKVAWIAVRDKPLGRVLEDLDLERTGEFEAFVEGEFCCVTLGDWVLVVNNFAMGSFILEKPLDRVKRGAEVLTCYVNETTMMSCIEGFRNGAKLWSVMHDCEKGNDHLDIDGFPPEPFAAIRDGLLAQQAATTENVDYTWDIAPALGEALTGFRHDQEVRGLGELPFELLEPVRVPPVPPKKKPSWSFGQ